ncbi:MAG: sulfur oxidation c-type cytochrome SoxA [Pseudomonadales bacterium]
MTASRCQLLPSVWPSVWLLLLVSGAQGCERNPPDQASVTKPATTAASKPVRSGYDYQSAQTQALQDDDFANPGTLWLDQGAVLWQQAPDDNIKSCADCHDQPAQASAASMRGTALRYPALDPNSGALIDLAGRINRCRTEQQQQPPWPLESEPLLALTTLVTAASHGMTVNREITPELQPFFDAGRDYFYGRRGQLNLACHQCHEQQAGQMLRGDRLSEGHSNGYPAYRLQWQSIGSLQRRLRFCNVGVRAEPFAYGAPEYLNLELFLQWRGKGLRIETPAVRR